MKQVETGAPLEQRSPRTLASRFSGLVLGLGLALGAAGVQAASAIAQRQKASAAGGTRSRAARPTTAQPLSTGDWPLPTAFFPGFDALQPAAAPSPPAKPKATAKKGGVRKAPPAQPAARKTAATKSSRRR